MESHLETREWRPGREHWAGVEGRWAEGKAGTEAPGWGPGLEQGRRGPGFLLGRGSTVAFTRERGGGSEGPEQRRVLGLKGPSGCRVENTG